MIEKDDWRLMGQEKYLLNKELKFIESYEPYSKTWEHEHCVFCMEKISSYEGDLRKGYCTLDERSFICEECFEDFKEIFNWKIINEGNIVK